MKNIQAKKKLLKMADKWMKRGMRHEFDECDFLEDMWNVALKAYPEMKTSEDSYYISEGKLSHLVTTASEELELEAA